MASSSSDPMDDGSFRARVHKVFGSLSSSPSPSMSPALKPLWSLTDEEVEKREWNRSKGKDDDETICSSSLDGLFKRNRRGARPKGFGDDLEDLSGDEDGNRKEDLSGDEDGESRDVREIRSSIGLDKTLDNEEEEDEYDRLAEGKGKARSCFRKDPRADQIAAQVRLKEDAAEAAKYEPNFSDTEVSGEKHESKATSDDCSKLRPILKRKGVGEGRSKKRVRFDPSFVDESEDAPERGTAFSDASSTEDTKARDSDSLFDENKPKVPDHLINPSKYTRYSLDSCGEVDDESNSVACRYVLEEVKKWKNNLQTEEPSSTLPKSVSFVPKKKTNSAIVMEDATEDASKEILNQPSFPVGIAAWEAQRGDSAPEEDDMQIDTSDDTGVCKPGRHYRSKSRVEDPVT
ncbi:uncharacterized protein LOC116003072 [Ipomoea triloba]|uniref:uncharacterized protein LOC116003072 n=1 Tax=Ipomoea triloba TaxID=35885 RepID=UPI00125DE134|nr:uncharacterized protein LOC116003072 [Ipomoea triloba]